MTTHDAARGDAAPPDAAAAGHWVAYVGGYGPSIGWYEVDHASGALTMAGSVPATGASFLAFDQSRTHVYAVDETNSRVVAFAIDQASGALTKLNDQSSGGSGPAHLTVAGNRVLVANYGDGAVSVLPIAADGSLGAPTQTVNAGSHAHEIVIHGAYAFVPCLGSDYVAQYTWDGNMLAPNAVPHMMTTTGAGPRHIVFAAPYAYLVDEVGSTLMTLAIDDSTGRLSPLQTQTTLPAGFSGQNTAAEVQLRGGFLYASNRGADDIAVFSLGSDGHATPVTYVATGGQTPRHFSLSPDGKLLFAANQGSNSVVPFAITNGIPAPTAEPITTQAPTFVEIAVLP